MARRRETEDGGSVSHRWSPKNVSYELRNRADASHASSIRAHERRIGQRRQTPSAPASGGLDRRTMSQNAARQLLPNFAELRLILWTMRNRGLREIVGSVRPHAAPKAERARFAILSD